MQPIEIAGSASLARGPTRRPATPGKQRHNARHTRVQRLTPSDYRASGIVRRGINRAGSNGHISLRRRSAHIIEHYSILHLLWENCSVLQAKVVQRSRFDIGLPLSQKQPLHSRRLHLALTSANSLSPAQNTQWRWLQCTSLTLGIQRRMTKRMPPSRTLQTSS